MSQTSTHPLVVGIDFTEHSRAALLEAARLAQAMSSPLEALTVIPENAIELLLQADNSSKAGILETAAANLASWISSELPAELASIEVKSYAEVGDPYEQLIARTDDRPEALLVLGSRGTETQVGRAGAVASRCVRRASSPVLLVRRNHVQPFGRILVGYDFSAGSAAALRVAAVIACADSAELILAHVRQPVVLPDALGLGTYQPALNISDSLLPQIRRELEEVLAQVDFPLPERVRVEALVDTTPEFGLSQLAQQLEVQLLALGTHGRRGWRRLLLGTTAEHLIHESPCSVLAVEGKG